MIETLQVSVSGPAFSFLLYENIKGLYGQEGFLLGEIVEKETRTITDNDQRQVHVSRVVKVNSCVPCPMLCYFYDHVGRVDTEKIKSFLGDLTTKVVAWYKYKPASSFGLTFREKIVHKQLANFFKPAAEFFTCCLLINEASDNGATHSYSQTFIRLNMLSHEQLPLHIVNLSDANNTYRSSEPVSDSFSSVLKGLKINHKESQGLNIITKISSALQKQTVDFVENLAEAEKVLFQLENEVKEMQEIVKANQLLSSASNHANEGVFKKEFSPPDITANIEQSKKGRGRAKAAATKGEKRVSQSPAKRTSLEGEKDYTSRLRKRS